MNTDALSFTPKTLWQTLKVQDWLYAILLMAGAIFAYSKYSHHMDIYEESFLFGAAIVFSYLGWRWKNLAKLVIGVGVISLISISLYHGEQARATQAFFLKFLRF